MNRWSNVGALLCLVTLGLVTLGLVTPGAIPPTSGTDSAVAGVRHRWVPARADATVDSAHRDARHGSAPTLRYAKPRRVRAYLRFAVPAQAGVITKAELVLTSRSGSQHRTHLARTSAKWRERRLTWRNAPRVGAPLGSARPVRAGGRLVFDVTRAVTGAGRFGFVVTGGRAQAAVFSREARRHRPRLRLTIAPSTTTPAGWQPDFPIRAAFYYPWFPEAWRQQGFDPFTRYTPSLGYYSSSAPAVISAHVDDMVHAGIDAGISSWWGPGERTDDRVPALLAGAEGRRFRWALYYEQEGSTDPSATTIAADLSYVASRYADHPSYLRVGGRPVIFVYADPGDGCAMADRWRAANATAGFHVVLKDFSGYLGCASQPDDWHQYAPANATEVSATSFSVSPGFWRPDEPPRLSRDPARFAHDLAAMVASRKRWQLITTWNEWGEGTAVEGAHEWASTSGRGVYVDLMHAALAASGRATATRR